MPITIAALINLDKLDFAGRPGDLIYLNAYVIAFFVVGAILLLAPANSHGQIRLKTRSKLSTAYCSLFTVHCSLNLIGNLRKQIMKDKVSLLFWLNGRNLLTLTLIVVALLISACSGASDTQPTSEAEAPDAAQPATDGATVDPEAGAAETAVVVET